MRSPAGISRIGSWKTTRSIGRECKAGDRLSRPVLTAERLDHPDPAPPNRGGAIAAARSALVARASPIMLPIHKGRGLSVSEYAVDVSTRPTESSRPAGLNPPAGRLPGDHTRGATPVPIPNTAVKPAGPMIVRQRESRSSPGSSIPESPPIPPGSGGFLCAPLSSHAPIILVPSPIINFRAPSRPAVGRLALAIPLHSPDLARGICCGLRSPS